jgi:hypothetical protein
MKAVKVGLVVFVLFVQVLSQSYNESISKIEENSFLQTNETIFQSNNNSSSNNSGGGNNSNVSDAHCLILTNFTISQTNYVSIHLINICSAAINYPGINASADHSGVSGLYDTWWYVISGNNGTTNNSNVNHSYQMGWQLSFNQSLLNGTNITLDFEATVLNCGPNNSWANDCPNSNNSSLSYQFQYISPETNLVISSFSFNTNNDRISLSYYSLNYSGYVAWEYTSANGTSTSSSYSNSYVRTTYFYPDFFGIVQICGSISGDIACINATRIVRPLYGEIDSPSDNFTTNSNSIYVSYFAHNYSSGTLELNNQTVHYLQSSNTNNSGNNSNNSIMINIPSGWSTLCLKLTGDNNTSLEDCVNVYKPPAIVRLIIDSATLSSDNNMIVLRYKSENWSGQVIWDYTSANGTTMSYSYASSYLRTTHIYPSTFGLIEICGTINNSTTECISVNRVARILEGEIDSPSDNFTTNSNSINVSYFAQNYSNGTLELNNQTVHYLQSSNANNSGNNSIFVNLPAGWSTLCLKLTGDNSTLIEDCVNVYRPPPIVRLIIDSATLSSDNNMIVLRYKSENYSGTVQWAFNSSNGTSFSSSYASNYLRTTYIYPSTFGLIEICGTISNFTTECISVNRIARILEGDILSPNNNSQYHTNTVQITYTANNFIIGSITLDGVTYRNLGSSFDSNETNSSNSNYSQNHLQIGYGFSTICLELSGDNGAQLSDCIVVERVAPPHNVFIVYPVAGVSFTGQFVNLNYVLENSSGHHFTVNNITISPIDNSTSNSVELHVGYGIQNVCVISYDYAGTVSNACVVINMINPNADSDSDGVADNSDLCQNTITGSVADTNGCAPYQLDNDADGISDAADICSSTQQFSSVDAVGCAAYQRDTDGDGVMDNLDLCNTTPVNSVIDPNGCAISQLDSDNDGIMDDVDICPGTIVGSQVNAVGCSSSQRDTDSDGIVDSFDQCPSTIIGTVVDQTGCNYNNANGNISSGNGSSGTEDPGLPGFESTMAIVSICIAFFVGFSKKKESEN